MSFDVVISNLKSTMELLSTVPIQQQPKMGGYRLFDADEKFVVKILHCEDELYLNGLVIDRPYSKKGFSIKIINNLLQSSIDNGFSLYITQIVNDGFLKALKKKGAIIFKDDDGDNAEIRRPNWIG